MNEQNKARRIYATGLLILIIVLVLFICGRITYLIRNPEQTAEADVASMQKSLEECQAEADSLLQQMSLREKVCQMLIVTPEALSGDESDTVFTSNMQVGLEQYPVGGVVLFRETL